MAWASTFDVFLNSYVVKIIAQAVSRSNLARWPTTQANEHVNSSSYECQSFHTVCKIILWMLSCQCVNILDIGSGISVMALCSFVVVSMMRPPMDQTENFSSWT